MTSFIGFFNNEKSLFSKGLFGNGIFYPSFSANNILYVWILSSNITPQPNNKRGIWVDADVWNDLNRWYD